MEFPIMKVPQTTYLSPLMHLMPSSLFIQDMVQIYPNVDDSSSKKMCSNFKAK